MSIVSKKLRKSENKQKVLHAKEPTFLAKGRVAKRCHCDVRKWATDPIEFAQRNGRLL